MSDELAETKGLIPVRHKRNPRSGGPTGVGGFHQLMRRPNKLGVRRGRYVPNDYTKLILVE
jgi:hypothetical protein